jgi:beta-N-acetylhexosaminidase
MRSTQWRRQRVRGTQRALITGLSGLTLTADEARFLADVRPCGIILFARNCASRDQIRTLVQASLEAIGTRDVLVLIDQEGGRVQRLRPPLAHALPPAANYARLYALDPDAACRAAFDTARLVASELRALGINTNCTPVLDVPVPGSHDIIGDRAFGTAPTQVVALARAVADGHMAGGVVPVIKHIPGHGRATADSHLDLPVVTASHADLSATDCAPFKALAHMPAAMTAHVVYTAIDAQAPATTSKRAVRDIIRGEIGFGGLLMSDDLSMKALTGSISDRAKASIAAGCDVALHCNGEMAEMRAAASGVPLLDGVAGTRFEAALAVTRSQQPFDELAAIASLDRALKASHAGVESV